MIINRGFGKFKLNEEIDNGELFCTACKSIVDDYENINKIILFQSAGDIQYRLNGKPRPPMQKHPFEAKEGQLVLYGSEQNHEEYSSFIITVERILANPQDSRKNLEQKMIAGLVPPDKHGNPIGSIYDLGRDNAFSEIKLLIGKFYNGERFTLESFKTNVGKALDEKGFDWLCTEDENEYLEKLPDYDVSIILPSFGKKVKRSDFIDKVITFYRSGKGLMLFEDNDPTQDSYTTGVLKKLFGITVEGNDPGQRVMNPGTNVSNSLTFDQNHDVFKGVFKLYEGITISHPNIDSLPSPLKVLSTSSSGHPNIMCVEKNINSNRLLIDCGYTKLFKKFWDTAGTGRYVRNAVCWLAGASCD